MAQGTLYELLMLDPTATRDVITAVFRHLAKRHHPDRVGAGAGDAERMAQINEAYAILKDPAKRARYDEIIGVSKDGAARREPRQSVPGATNLKYEGGAWEVRSPEEPTPASAAYGEAGPPPPWPAASGRVISFGRYRGWSISQVVAHDRNYVEWLSRTMAGRNYRDELEDLLRRTPA